MFFGHSYGGFDLGELTRNDDLTRRIDVGNIDVFVSGLLSH